MATALAINGHPDILKDQLHRHLRNHADPSAADPEAEPSTLTFAVVVAGALSGWPALASQVGQTLASYGMHAESEIVLAAMPGTMRAALVAAEGTDASQLLEARALARVVGTVLPQRYPDAALAVADALDAEELPQMAAAFREVAARLPRQTEREQTTPTTAPAGGGESSTAGTACRVPSTTTRERS